MKHSGSHAFSAWIAVLSGAGAASIPCSSIRRCAVPLDRDLARHAAHVHLHLRHPGAGAERRRRLHGPAAPGHRGILRHRRLHHRHPDRAGLSVSGRLLLAAGVLRRWERRCSGVVLGAPTLRLRGDYLAIVTLGFGEVVRFTLRNLEEITGRHARAQPRPAAASARMLAPPLDWHWHPARLEPGLPAVLLSGPGLLRGRDPAARTSKRSRLGRAWVAIREDELAATCMGINAARVKLSAFALGCGLAGLAGCLYATTLTSTAGPDAFDFNRSIIMLCCIILGGLGSLRGTLLGVVLLIGFDNVARARCSDGCSRSANINPNGSPLLTFSNWKLMIFGLALILMMRFRPEGLLPSRHIEAELTTTAATRPSAREDG